MIAGFVVLIGAPLSAGMGQAGSRHKDAACPLSVGLLLNTF